MINENPQFTSVELNQSGRVAYATSADGGLYRVSGVSTDQVEISELYHPQAQEMAAKAAAERKAKEDERIAKNKAEAEKRREKHDEEREADRVRKAQELLAEKGLLNASKPNTKAGDETSSASDESEQEASQDAEGDASNVEDKPARRSRSRRAKSSEQASEAAGEGA